jgi:hypothetical protein
MTIHVSISISISISVSVSARPDSVESKIWLWLSPRKDDTNGAAKKAANVFAFGNGFGIRFTAAIAIAGLGHRV